MNGAAVLLGLALCGSGVWLLKMNRPIPLQMLNVVALYVGGRHLVGGEVHGWEVALMAGVLLVEIALEILVFSDRAPR